MLAASGAKSHPPIQEKTDHLIAVQAASTLPSGITSLLPEEPSTIREAQESPDWSHWKGALDREMNGQVNNGIWVQVERPKGKTVQGTTTLLKRKIGKDDQIEKCKCCFVTQGFHQVKGLHYHESSSPTPKASSMRAVLATAAVKNWELRHIDVEQAYLQPISIKRSTSNYPKTTARFRTRSACQGRPYIDWCNQDYDGSENSQTVSKRRASNSPTRIHACSGESSTAKS